jgi:diguanylate cyclase (GGDEF)-like protein
MYLYFKDIIYNFITSNYKTDEHLLLRRLILINTFLLAGLFAFTALFIVNTFIKEDSFVAILDGIGIIVFLLTFIDLRLNKNENRTIFIATFSLSILMFILVLINHNKNFGLIWTIFVPILSITLYGHKKGAYISLAYYSIIFILAIYGLETWDSDDWNSVSLIRFMVSSLVLLFVMFITEYSFVKMQRSLNELILIDPLTKLFNRRKIDEVINNSLKSLQRNNFPLSLVILDIDNFKSINDTYGHLIGDEVLKTISKILKDTFRDVDSVGRWGGEEFIIILPETSLDNAKVSLERLRNTINNYNFDTVGHISCSYGLCTVKESILSQEEFIKYADDALYEAKKSGKDCIVIAKNCS